MTMRGSWDVTLLNWIKEAAFGTTPTTGTKAWKPISLVKRFEPIYQPVFKPKVGLGRQNPSDWTLVKEYYEFNIEVELIKYEASPLYDWYDLAEFIIEPLTGADGAPEETMDSFSLCAKVDLATDEFWWLKGCMLDRVELVGGGLDELVTGRFHGLAQWGDYGTTDAMSGTATREAVPAVMAQIPYGECDLLYDPTSPASIYEDVNSWQVTLRRTLEMRGTDSTTATLYRTFVPTARSWEVEFAKDFDSKDEYEDFVDAAKTKVSVEIPNAEHGHIFAFTSGYFMPGSGLPVNELDLMNVRLQGEFGELAVSDHG